ncbi:MAG: hypothetical protein R3300_22090 [Candidatus Promineifilaceae bacterium]|nr:hypothetical protein [Candidatus Promineifilaceae bacterium]
MAWVPIRTIYGSEGSHIDNRTHLRNFLRLVWQTRRRRARFQRQLKEADTRRR